MDEHKIVTSYEEVIQSIIEFGHLHILENFYREHDHTYDFNHCLSQAVIYGRMEIVQWLYDRIPNKQRSPVLELCCCAIDNGQREIFQWLFMHKGGTSFATYFMIRATQQKQMHILQWMKNYLEFDADDDDNEDEPGGGGGGAQEENKMSGLSVDLLYKYVRYGRTLAIEKVYITMPALPVKELIETHAKIIRIAAARGHAPVLEWIHGFGFLCMLDHPRETILVAIENGRVNVLDYMLVICPNSFEEHYIEYILIAFEFGHLPVLQWCYDHLDKMDKRFFDQYGDEIIKITTSGQFLHVFTWLDSVANDVFPQFTTLIEEVQTIPLKTKKTLFSENWKMIKRNGPSAKHSSSSTALTVPPSSPLVNIMTVTAAASTIVNNVALLSSSPVVKSLQYWLLNKPY